MRAFLLAGGFATRLWPLTESRPKPLLPLAGKPIITHLVEKLPQDLPVTVSTNAAFAEEFRAWQETLNRESLSLVIEDTREDDQKLGALGALAQWVRTNTISEDVLVLTGDNYFGFSFAEFLRAATPGHPLLATHDIGSLDAARAFGTVTVDPAAPARGAVRRVTGFEEKAAHPKSTLVSTGCSILPAATLPIVIEYARAHPDNIGGIFEELLRRGVAIESFTFSEPWLDIGSFRSYLDAHQLLLHGTVVRHPSAIVERSDLEGSVAIGAGCTIEASQLRDCVIFEGCSIRDCVLEECVIDEHCDLEGVDLRGKMLRGGSRLIAPQSSPRLLA
jgi:glucose-1-phosphate thymidylyltransferase